VRRASTARRQGQGIDGAEAGARASMVARRTDGGGGRSGTSGVFGRGRRRRVRAWSSAAVDARASAARSGSLPASRSSPARENVEVPIGGTDQGQRTAYIPPSPLVPGCGANPGM
jgi:hypothetical protein